MPRDLWIVLAASTTRAFAIGALSVFFGLYLAGLGLSEPEIGLVIAAGLAGMAAGTLLAGLVADTLGRRKSLTLVALLMATGGIVLSAAEDLPFLLIASFIGMVNGMGRDRGPAQAIDQAMLAQGSPPEKRTSFFSTYTFLLDLGTAAGALAAGIPSTIPDYRVALIVYSIIVIVAASAYLLTGASIETPRPQKASRLSPRSRRLIGGFAALSVLDSLGGGFITRSLLTFWFFKRFDVDPFWIGVLFAAASVVNAISYFVATRIAKRIGLVNTMVSTHIPSSLLLLVVPFAPNFPLAVSVFLLREFFAPMDVPTRQSYLAAIVADHERTAAAAIVNMTRNASWVAGPLIAGWAMTFSFSAPLFLAAMTKITYDIALWISFRKIKPPEEKNS